jgi:triphosphoribosyl-dephospho-CoA synthase
MTPDQIASSAVAAMLIELSSSPKPGNVDRCHDFVDATFQQFSVSVVSSYAAFRKAGAGEGRIGQLLLEAVESKRAWNILGNTHFGSLILMIPLAMAARECDGNLDLLPRTLARTLKESSVDDAIDFYASFSLVRARVVDVEEFSLKDPASLERLRCQELTLLDLMRLSQGHDLIAKEWSTEFERCFDLSRSIRRNVAEAGMNDGVVKTYLQALSAVPDSLICAKFGPEKAAQVREMAGSVLEDGSMAAVTELDRHFLEKDINPGSTADLIAAALFIALLNGLRF